MFGDNIFDELMEMIKSKECYSNSSLVFKCISNAIESYEEVIDKFREGKIQMIDISEEDKKFITNSIISINSSLATAVLAVADLLKKSKLDLKEFTTGVDMFLKEKNLELISYSDVILALESYGNHLRIEGLCTDPRISTIDLTPILSELDDDYKAGITLDFGKPLMLWALLGKATEKISVLSEVQDANNKETIYMFIEAFAAIFRITSFFGFDIKYLTYILKDEKTSF